MVAPSSAATACFVSPLPPPRRPRHFLRHLARAAVAEPTPAPASASSLAHPSPWPWAQRLCDLVPTEAVGRLLSSVVGSLIVALAFASLILGDTDAASAFVVSTPRKLQADELATVRLFQENTPSVVYITNLAVRQDAFTLDVLEVTQGSGSGFVWDKSGHIVTNFHVIRGASDLRLVGTTECFMLSYYTFLVVWLCSNRSLSILVLMVRVVGVSLKYGLAFQ
ncbi:protease Do-like 8, chloroplastic [Zea mays]|uniref:protease Do-like 8, chloroplastic n=1 Tax=Zea mays TaxID=4577 RepID=UPI0004DE9B70|nr:protease Do-like 8, chloroplastic [Zea mays]|eukprot:XP_008652762.1 protease Do-like 8, chloroplastic [Zea mays]